MILFIFLIMLVLKLAGVIAWSWWIVCAPLLFLALLWVLGYLFGLAMLISLGRVALGTRPKSRR